MEFIESVCFTQHHAAFTTLLGFGKQLNAPSGKVVAAKQPTRKSKVQPPRTKPLYKLPTTKDNPFRKVNRNKRQIKTPEYQSKLYANGQISNTETPEAASIEQPKVIIDEEITKSINQESVKVGEEVTMNVPAIEEKSVVEEKVPEAKTEEISASLRNNLQKQLFKIVIEKSGQDLLRFLKTNLDKVNLSEYLMDVKMEQKGGPFIGWTPLHIASWRGDVEIIKILLSNGVNVNQKASIQTEVPNFASS